MKWPDLTIKKDHCKHKHILITTTNRQITARDRRDLWHLFRVPQSYIHHVRENTPQTKNVLHFTYIAIKVPAPLAVLPIWNEWWENPWNFGHFLAPYCKKCLACCNIAGRGWPGEYVGQFKQKCTKKMQKDFDLDTMSIERKIMGKIWQVTCLGTTWRVCMCRGGWGVMLGGLWGGYGWIWGGGYRWTCAGVWSLCQQISDRRAAIRWNWRKVRVKAIRYFDTSFDIFAQFCDSGLAT